MSHLPNAEVGEEDAADLQFPKEWIMEAAPALACFTCGDGLREPYIRCVECEDVNLCTSCFASGAESLAHSNCHDYAVIKNEFCLFEGSSWTAMEEIDLLDALLDCGFGNWDSVSCRVHTKSAAECEQHYLTNYVLNGCLPGFPKLKRSPSPEKTAPLPVFDDRLGDIDEPPRYSVNSSSYRALAGYSAGRSDFEVEFDNFAEDDINDLDYEIFQEKDDYHELGQALQLAVVGKYNERLKERARRKKVIREHGLIVARKAVTWQKRYEQALTHSVVDRLIPCAQLVSGMQMDLFMEGLKMAVELRQRLSRLCHLRENGITSFYGSQVYYKLLRNRKNYLKERKMYLASSQYCWRSVIDSFPSSTQALQALGNSRRPAAPLDIVGLPMYEKLTPGEKCLCSAARIVPEAYLVFKDILISEYRRHGSLKLAQARTLIKIDVNKTRKVFDFLLKEGYISQ